MATEPNERFLILMRHAKSDWSDESLSDHDRPLNPRGRNAAPRMAGWLAEIGIVPDLILSSSSVRTRETVSLMSDQWGEEAQVSYSESLYLASPETILSMVRSDACGAERLMVVAHNPGMAHLASVLSQQSLDMPTAAIAIFELGELDWLDLQPGSTLGLVHYMRPKAL